MIKCSIVENMYFLHLFTLTLPPLHTVSPIFLHQLVLIRCFRCFGFKYDVITNGFRWGLRNYIFQNKYRIFFYTLTRLKLEGVKQSIMALFGISTFYALKVRINYIFIAI